jgi:hypothetical protein
LQALDLNCLNKKFNMHLNIFNVLSEKFLAGSVVAAYEQIVSIRLGDLIALKDRLFNR